MKTLYRKTGNLVSTDIEIQVKTIDNNSTTTRTGFGEEVKLPTDTECFDAYMELQKKLTKSGQKANFLDTNSWLMACNWMKDFLTENNE